MTSVTLVTSPMDGSCGIGTYSKSLLEQVEDAVDVRTVILETDDTPPVSFFSYAKAAIRAGGTDDDVIHVQHEYGLFGTKWYLLWLFYPLLFVLSRIHGTPVVVTVHEAWNSDRVTLPMARAKRFYIWLANKLIAGTATSVIFLSANCQEKFERSVSVSDVYCFTHGVGDTVEGVTEADAKAAFGFEPSDIVVTEPGYVRPSKGYDTFLEIARRFPECEFLVAGGSRGADAYFESIAERAPANVTVTGHLAEDRFHLAFIATDVAVLPYDDVAQSGIFNWCAAYELPTVATRLPYFERLQLEYGCLLLFDTASEAEGRIRESISEQQTRGQLIDGMRSFRQDNSFANVGKKHVSVYRELT